MASRGQFVWEELTTTDTTSAGGFYGKVAGLKTEAAPGGSSYTLFIAMAGRMGGLLALGADAGASPHWLSYLSTLNVDETARQAESLGGRVVKPPAQMGDGGRFAVLQDPQGAVFAVYTPPRPSDRPPAVSFGSMSWHELATTDHVSGFLFYQTLFGWHIVNDMDMGPGMGIYRLFAAEGSSDQMGGMYTKPAQQPGPPAWLPYIKVANVAGATAKAKSLGATIFHGPAQVPGGGWITMGADPQGAAFAVHSTPAAAAPKKKAPPKKKAKSAAKKKAKAAPKRKSKASAKKKAAPKKKKKAGSKK
jgi:predicted enzyme related to lactoylglutathione lyase